jgi:hypothetical protein
VLEKFVADLRARHKTGTAKETAEPHADDADGGKYFYERVSRRYAKGGAVKAGKSEVHYRPGFEDGKFCALCDMWVEPSSCTAVAGTIGRTDLCDLFKKA